MQSTLLVGPADWDARRMPKDEFAARIAAFWRRCPTAGGAIVYGGRAHHAELAYLTSFTPKLEAALALIPRAGAPQLMVGGGVNMLPAAKPLTWIDDLRPLRNVAATISEWAGRQRGNGRPALIGGPSMPHALRQELAKALGDGIEDKTADLAALMRRKSAHEIAALRAACATLGVAMTAIGDAQRAGAGATAAVLAGERAAHRRGAQDVRTLFSLDGGVSLRPLDTPVERAVDPLQVYIAVRQLGYWAEGFAVVGASPLAGALQAVLHSVLPRVQAGKPCSEVAHAIGEAIRPKGPHPVSARIVGNAVGLALEESPLISAECGARFESGGVYSLRAGACDEQATSAIVSAMVLVKDDGNELLWPHAAAVK